MAHHSVRTLDVPVLVTAGEPDESRRVLAAVDLSYAAGPTLEVAVRLARVTGAKLRLLHVIEAPPEYLAALPVRIDTAEYRRRAEGRLATLAAAVAGTTPVERIVREGSAVDAIADACREWDADLVVVGSHGKGWVDRVIIGSVAEKVLNRLAASTVVVPVRAPTGGATSLAPARGAAERG